MTPSTPRVERFRERQKDAGRRLLTTWISPEALRRLRALAKGRTLGDAIEHLLDVSKNGLPTTEHAASAQPPAAHAGLPRA